MSHLKNIFITIVENVVVITLRTSLKMLQSTQAKLDLKEFEQTNSQKFLFLCAGENFFGTPAILYGNYGKGKVIATSFHPESRIDSHKIFCGCFYAVTGVKLTPQFPRRQFHPLRVGYHFVNAQYKDQRAVINEVMELESHPELAVELGLDAEILNRVDVVVLGDARGLSWKDFIDAKRYDILIDFIHRGGKVIAVGEIWKKIPPHKNVIYVNPGKDVIKSVMNFIK